VKPSIDRILIVAMLLLTVGLILVVYPTLQVRVIQAGDTGPDFSIVTEQGKTVTRSDFGGKVLILNFWASWCATCLDELPSMNQFAREYKNQGVVVLGISIDKNERLYRKFLTDMHVAYDTARDPEATISASYGTFLLPETYVMDRNGKVMEKADNAFNWMDPQFLQRVKGML
jgi:cytochrome c biogenesis protein CcmG/thiol:disulfide interchange protein DsbE